MSKVVGQNLCIEFAEKLPKDAYVTTECTIVTKDGDRIPVIFDERDTATNGKRFEFSLHGRMDCEIPMENVADKLAEVEISVFVEPEELEAKVQDMSVSFDIDNGMVLGISKSKISFPFCEEKEMER